MTIERSTHHNQPTVTSQGKETQIEVDLSVQAWKDNYHERNDLQALKLQMKFNNSIEDKFFREVTF